MTTIHVDLRELSGEPTDDPVPAASFRVAPAERIHIEGASDYVLTENFLEVKILDGVAEFDVPPTEMGQALVVNEWGFRGARTRYVQVPDQADADYGDLVEVDPATLDPTATPDAAWWAELDQQVVGGEVVGDDLFLERQNATTFNAGNVRGPQGPAGVGGTLLVTPEQHGAEGDGTTDDTTAIQDAIDEVAATTGGIVAFTPGKTYRAGGLELKTGVILNGFGDGVKWADNNMTAKITPPTGWAGGWVVDSAVTQIRNAGVIGLGILGGVAGAGSPDTGGIRIQDGDWCTVDSITVGSVSLGAVNVNGTANIIRGNALSNTWEWRGTLSADEGVLKCTGTDFWIENNQVNGLTELSSTISTTLDDLHKCANLFSLFTSWIIGGNGEFSEVGWKISLYESVVMGIRGDTNPGVGIYITPSVGGGTRYTNLMVLANCLSPSANGVLSHMYVNDYKNHFDGITFGLDWTASGNTPRYGLVDFALTTGQPGHELAEFSNSYSRIRSLPGSYLWDEATRHGSFPFNYREGGSGNPSARPAARFSAGQTWWDTIGNQLTISNGSSWRTTANAIAGNILTPAAAYATDGAIHWDAVSARCTVTHTGATASPRFYRPTVVTLTTLAAGVTAGSVGITLKTGDAATVVAGSVYQFGCQANGPTGKSPQGSLTVTWRDAALATIGSPVTAVAATAITAGDATRPTRLLSAGLTAPALATSALITFTGTCTGLATNDVFKIANFSVTLGSTQTDLHEV